MSDVNYKSAIESLLFAWGESLSITKISNIIEIPRPDVKAIMEELIENYNEVDRGVKLIEVNQSYQLVTKEVNYRYLEKLCKTTKTRGLSTAMTEVLAIIAYKQPITKHEIDMLRGVKSDKPLTALLDRQLAEVKGILERIGSPKIYGTSEEFLRSFGFKNIKELPDIADLDNIKLFDAFTIEEELEGKKEEAGSDVTHIEENEATDGTDHEITEVYS